VLDIQLAVSILTHSVLKPSYDKIKHAVFYLDWW